MNKTKTNTMLLLLLLLVAAPMKAQLKVGVTAGLNICQLHITESDYKEYTDRIRPGFIVGPTVIYNVPKTGLGFDVSALYDLRAAKSKDNEYSKTIYNYSFQFPVNVRYGMAIGDMVHAFLFTGPQFGVAVGNKDQLVISGRGRSTGHPMERRWVAEKSSFSWNFGIGGVVEEKIQVRISYNLAIKYTGELQQVDLVTGTARRLSGGKAHALQVAVSYLF